MKLITSCFFFNTKVNFTLTSNQQIQLRAKSLRISHIVHIQNICKGSHVVSHYTMGSASNRTAVYKSALEAMVTRAKSKGINEIHQYLSHPNCVIASYNRAKYRCIQIFHVSQSCFHAFQLHHNCLLVPPTTKLFYCKLLLVIA